MSIIGVETLAKTRPFLVTGCGRSGTGWAAKVFTGLGLDCGHERSFNIARHGPLDASDSSWLAMPFLDRLPENTFLVHVVRRATDVVTSVIERGFLRTLDGPYERFAVKHLPELEDAKTHMERAVTWACRWDYPILTRNRDMIHVDQSSSVYDVCVVAENIIGNGVSLLNHAEYLLNKIGRSVNANPRRLSEASRRSLRQEIMSFDEVKARDAWLGFSRVPSASGPGEFARQP